MVTDVLAGRFSCADYSWVSRFFPPAHPHSHPHQRVVFPWPCPARMELFGLSASCFPVWIVLLDMPKEEGNHLDQF